MNESRQIALPKANEAADARTGQFFAMEITAKERVKKGGLSTLGRPPHLPHAAPRSPRYAGLARITPEEFLNAFLAEFLRRRLQIGASEIGRAH